MMPPSVLAAIADQAGDVAVYLAAWDSRDEAPDKELAREGADLAIAEIEAMIGRLSRLRAGLLMEIRRWDDATAGCQGGRT